MKWINQLKKHKKDYNKSFNQLSQETGLSKQTLVKIVSLDEVGVLNMRLKNIIVLNKELKVDMSEGIDYNKAKLLKLTHKHLTK
jgi:hypothetical protein